MIMRDVADNSSSLETVPDVTTKVTTGSEAASTMSSMSLGTGCQPLRLRQRSSSIVCSPLTPSLLTPPMLTLSQTRWLKPQLSASMTS
jgi:hypothetical protein